VGRLLTIAAGLLNIPNSDSDWDRWSFDLDQNIKDIQQALLAQQKLALPQQQIYPRPNVDIQLWLERVSTALGEITSALKITSQDVENVDLDDERERQAWIWSVFSEVRDARAALKI
jgi:hypothetical protein